MSEPQSKDVGLTLKTERERQGLTLDMVHDATKIPLDSLKAIEEGYKVRTLSPFYFKSFVRIYAQFLNLDPSVLLSETPSSNSLKAYLPPADKPVAPKMQQTRSLNLFARGFHPNKGIKVLKVAGAFLAVFAVLFFVVSFVKRLPQKSAQPLPVKETSVKKAPALKKVEEPKKVEAPKPQAPKAPAQEVKKAEAAQQKAADEKTTAQDKPAEKLIAAKSLKNVAVSVRARENSWLNVKSDGKAIFQGILKKGNFQSWTATKSIELSGKDIDELEFEVNGKSIGKLSRRDMKAKKVLITPEGLTVEK